MAFVDILARDPKSEEEFWTIIEETFVLIEGALTDYPVETREEALDVTLPLRGGNSKDTSVSIIRYRGVDKDIDSRDYFLELGREFLLEVKQQIEARVLTPKFAKDWGVVMMCHGFISAHILDDSDGLSQVRAGLKSAGIRNRDAQRKWIAHQMLPLIDQGIDRGTAEQTVARKIKKIVSGRKFPSGFNRAWFAVILTYGELASTYEQKHLSVKLMRKLAAEPRDDIPPIDFPWNGSRG